MDLMPPSEVGPMFGHLAEIMRNPIAVFEASWGLLPMSMTQRPSSWNHLVTNVDTNQGKYDRKRKEETDFGQIESSIIEAMNEVCDAIDIDLNRPFVEYGLDSLGAIEFRAILSNKLGLKGISSTIVYDFPNASLLASHLGSLLKLPSVKKSNVFLKQETLEGEIFVLGMSYRFAEYGVGGNR